MLIPNQKSKLNERLFNLDRCMRYLHDCQDLQGKNHPEALGLTIGELDWLSELHRLLYEEN